MFGQTGFRVTFVEIGRLAGGQLITESRLKLRPAAVIAAQ